MEYDSKSFYGEQTGSNVVAHNKYITIISFDKNFKEGFKNWSVEGKDEHRLSVCVGGV